ncbi:MAG: hypothetical protein V9F06_03545 [Thermomicrobiales bacterium]
MSEQFPDTPSRTTGGSSWRRGKRRWAAIITLALVIGALVIGGTVAAESGSSTTGSGGLKGTFLTHLADNLGIGRDKLDQAMISAGDQTVDDAVTSGKLTQQQGDAMKKRIANGDFFSFGRHHGRFGRGMFGHGDGMATIASTLGISTDDLKAELKSGSTLEQVITAHGSTVQTVVDALVAQTKTNLTQAVTNGKLTQEQADKILNELPSRLTEMIQNGFSGKNMPFDGNHHGNPNDTTPEATPTV